MIKQPFIVRIFKAYDLNPLGRVFICEHRTVAKTAAEAIRNIRWRVFGRGYLYREYQFEANPVY